MLLFVSLIFSVAVSAQEENEVKVVKPAKYQESILEKDVQLVDVRTREEYLEGHIEGAENIDFFADDFLVQFEKFHKDKPLYIYCRSGNRSSKAATKLKEAGFSRIIDLEGGYKAWPKGQE